ncbi:hypothetical protein PVAP13_9KG536126 [Panicum virgatum]|uniref:Uncharacterized protein n=1 Tax=Panicum virgatum TaxID=38727 RepID=A0A8T0NYP1_PANVG|nr:hypothetical protein PVAP13_9KG536126 [Panicum virgatum]
MPPLALAVATPGPSDDQIWSAKPPPPPARALSLSIERGRGGGSKAGTRRCRLACPRRSRVAHPSVSSHMPPTPPGGSHVLAQPAAALCWRRGRAQAHGAPPLPSRPSACVHAPPATRPAACAPSGLPQLCTRCGRAQQLSTSLSGTPTAASSSSGP